MNIGILWGVVSDGTTGNKKKVVGRIDQHDITHWSNVYRGKPGSVFLKRLIELFFKMLSGLNKFLRARKEPITRGAKIHRFSGRSFSENGKQECDEAQY